MNLFAYLASGRAIRMVSNLSAAKVILQGTENIPRGSIIFVINHFTRLETVLMPLHIYNLTKVPVWSLGDYRLFEGPLAGFLDRMGVVSTKDPDRDLLIVKTLLTGEANWVIYPEGQMVKDKKIVEKTKYLLFSVEGKRPAHTGAAVLALRTEFYRQRLRRMAETNPVEVKRLMELFQIDSLDPVLARNTWIVPVNITYYPLRAYENILSRLATRLLKNISQRALEEIMTEGTMLLSGVDIDIRFGEPIAVKEYLASPVIQKDISSRGRINFDDPIASLPKLRQEAVDIMEKYMEEIYAMTTVNHDHLFASMLKLSPLATMDEDNLKRRVFLATVGELEQMGIYLHQSLRTNQVSLLTDDRFHKYRDFIALAVKKGIVRKEGKNLIRDSAKFATHFDLHQARIEHPVAVIANEVTSLAPLLKKIRAIAWLTPFQLRLRISDHLIRKANEDFTADYEAYFAAGESKPREVGSPRLIKGKSRELGVLLVHGFLAAPQEVMELAEYLGSKGLWVYVPRLKGHGTSPPDLASRTYPDWVESVDEGYAVMSNICRRVIVGGFSFGGGLVLDLAARVHGVAGVFAVCPPMKLQDISSRLAPAVGLWNRLMDIVNYGVAKKNFVEISPEHPQINYFRLPITGVAELARFMTDLEPKLPAIKIPTLIVQADGDPVVNASGSKSLFEQLGSVDKDYILFQFNRHGILMDEGADRVHKVIGDFITRVRRGQPLQPAKKKNAE
jgi:esterase/lipase/1-acyl-sn-glycerol-3-phosphate acyltransferase